MAKVKVVYKCTECGEISLKWLGQCSYCKAWNSLVKQEENLTKAAQATTKVDAVRLDLKENETKRVSTKISELDIVLGGGIVPGSLILLGGEPGAGKSTLLLEIARNDLKILYISGEESKEQVFERVRRLKIDNKNLKFVNENNLEQIVTHIEQDDSDIVFIDSIQTVYSSSGSLGSISQVREATGEFLRLAKGKSKPILMTGHITKDGQIAGPKHLEHSVDVVLYFEIYTNLDYRFIRSVKNRFGTSGEVAIFEMTSNGLLPVPSHLGLISLEDTGGVGSVLFPQVEGSRVMPIEIQVLVTPTGFANGRRIAQNIESSRLHLAAAILEKFAGMKLSQCDIYAKIAGGTYLSDAGADLALVLAMASSYVNKVIPLKTVAAGEVSLTGSIRSPIQLEKRIKTIESIGIEKAYWGGRGENSKAILFFSNLTDFLAAAL